MTVVVHRQNWAAAQNLGETAVSEQMISEAFWSSVGLGGPKVTDLTAKNNFPNMQFLGVFVGGEGQMRGGVV